MIGTRFALAAFLVASLASLPHAARGEEPAPAIKSPSGAFLYSFLGTVVPGAVALAASGPEDDATALLFLGGAVVGPSFGHFYAGRPGRAFAGIGIRSASVLGLAIAVGTSWDNPNTGSDVLAVASLVVGGGSMIFDIADAPHSARLHNQKANAVRVSVSPAAIGPDHAPGMRVDLGF
jgi:hypothetical protein